MNFLDLQSVSIAFSKFRQKGDLACLEGVSGMRVGVVAFGRKLRTKFLFHMKVRGPYRLSATSTLQVRSPSSASVQCALCLGKGVLSHGPAVLTIF